MAYTKIEGEYGCEELEFCKLRGVKHVVTAANSIHLRKDDTFTGNLLDHVETNANGHGLTVEPTDDNTLKVKCDKCEDGKLIAKVSSKF